MFDVYVKNTASNDVNNLRVAVIGLPSDWTHVEPATVANVGPNETAIFIVNLTVPNDAAVMGYPITLFIGADEMLAQKESVLNVITGEAVVVRRAEEIAAVWQISWMSVAYVAAGIAVASTAVFAVRKLKSSANREYRKDILMKVKNMVR